MSDAITISWKNRMKVMEALIMTVKSMAAMMVNNDDGEPDALTIKTLEGMTHMVSVIAIKLEITPEDVNIIVKQLDNQEEQFMKIIKKKDIGTSTIDDFIRPSA